MSKFMEGVILVLYMVLMLIILNPFVVWLMLATLLQHVVLIHEMLALPLSLIGAVAYWFLWTRVRRYLYHIDIEACKIYLGEQR